MPTTIQSSTLVCSLCGTSNQSRQAAEKCEGKGLLVPYYKIGETAQLNIEKYTTPGQLQRETGKVIDILFPKPENGFLGHGYQVIYKLEVMETLFAPDPAHVIGAEKRLLAQPMVHYQQEWERMQTHDRSRYLANDWVGSGRYKVAVGNFHTFVTTWDEWRRLVEIANPQPEIQTRLTELERLLQR
jgi:hypothetical protein